MPVYKRIQASPSTLVLIWKIEESIEELQQGISLSEASSTRVHSMKSELHQKGFLSIRHLLHEAGYSDFDVSYDAHGKPHLNDGRFISITHSFIFTAICISSEAPVGIDIEKQRDKIVKIAHKFTPIEEYNTLANHEALVRKLTIVWGGKESLYKIYGKKQLLFLHHIYIEDFSLDASATQGCIRYGGKELWYQIAFEEFEEFTCVYAYTSL